jgi:hypothetical protein
MQVAPAEILLAIASNLRAKDFRNFRLVNKRIANTTLCLIPKNGLSVLNTVRSLQGLKQLLGYPAISNNVREVTLFHGEWPICSRREWETHPLLCGGNDRTNACGIYPVDSTLANNAFAEYEAFITEEQSRRLADDVICLFEILKLLPNLRKFAITHIDCFACQPTTTAKYHSLQRRIWLTPYQDHDVAPAVRLFFLAAGKGFPNIKEFGIKGTLDPASLEIPQSAPEFSTLNISCYGLPGSEVTVQKFLQSFTNLNTLSISFHGWGPWPWPVGIGRLFWAHLSFLHLSGVWASEEEFYSLFERHKDNLQQFTLKNTALTQGISSSAQVLANGELYGRRNKDTIYMHANRIDLLAKFMQDQNLSWPF